MYAISLILAIISIVLALFSIYLLFKTISNNSYSVNRIIELELEKQEYERYILDIFFILKKREWHSFPMTKIKDSNKDFLTDEVKKVIDLLADSKENSKSKSQNTTNSTNQLPS